MFRQEVNGCNLKDLVFRFIFKRQHDGWGNLITRKIYNYKPTIKIFFKML
jgi:hypothetical protein